MAEPAQMLSEPSPRLTMAPDMAWELGRVGWIVPLPPPLATVFTRMLEIGSWP